MGYLRRQTQLLHRELEIMDEEDSLIDDVIGDAEGDGNNPVYKGDGKAADRTLLILVLGIAAYVLILSVPVLIFSSDKLKGELGLISGGIYAALMALHMRYTIEKNLYRERGHRAYSVWNSILRMTVLVVILALTAWSGWANVYTMMAGVFGLKISAYLTPYLQRFIKHNN